MSLKQGRVRVWAAFGERRRKAEVTREIFAERRVVKSMASKFTMAREFLLEQFFTTSLGLKSCLDGT